MAGGDDSSTLVKLVRFWHPLVTHRNIFGKKYFFKFLELKKNRSYETLALKERSKETSQPTDWTGEQFLHTNLSIFLQIIQKFCQYVDPLNSDTPENDQNQNSGHVSDPLKRHYFGTQRISERKRAIFAKYYNSIFWFTIMRIYSSRKYFFFILNHYWQ